MSILDKIRALGPDFTIEQLQASIALYAPFAPVPAEDAVARDIAYGPDARHRLDVFRPAAGVKGAPVLIYIHGGGFIGGDKGPAGSPFYNNVGAWGVAQGFVTVTATYRLAPQHRWPAGSEDMAAIVAWVRDNAAELGGDPERIVLMGQSAGAAHVANYVGHDRWRGEADASLAGAVMMSGVYDVARGPRGHLELSYYGEKEGEAEDPSALPGLAQTRLPCLFTVAEFDPGFMQEQALWVAEAWIAAKGGWPDFHRNRGHNHITPVLQIGSEHDMLGAELAEFVNRVTTA